MIVWRGRGIVTAYIFAACAFGIPVLWRLAHGVTDPALLKASASHLLFAFSLIVAGPFILGCGLYFNRNPNQLVLDRQTGRTVRAGRQHMFMYLAMEWWGVIILLGGVWMAIKCWGGPVQ